MRFGAITLVLLLTACASTPDPEVRLIEKRVIVTVPCVTHLQPPPVYATETADPTGDIFDLSKVLLAEIEQRKARELEQTAALEGCNQSGIASENTTSPDSPAAN